MTAALVPFASPRNNKASEALEIAIKDIITRMILSILDMRSAASTVVWTCKYLYVKNGTAWIIIKTPVSGISTIWVNRSVCEL
jgi:hypothetical protein